MFFTAYGVALITLWSYNHHLTGQCMCIDPSRQSNMIRTHERTARQSTEHVMFSPCRHPPGAWPYPFMARMTYPQRLLFHVSAIG